MKRAFAKLGEDIKEVKTICTTTQNEVKTISEEVIKLKQENEENREDIEWLVNENRELKTRLDELEQYGMKYNLIINGVPTKENENVREIIVRMAEKLNVTVQGYDIAAAHRLPSRRNKETDPIIVRFNNMDIRNQLIRQTKREKPEGKKFGFEPSLPIYVDEHLSTETKKIWTTAREMEKEGIIFKAIIREGKVKVKRRETSQIVRITGIDQLQYLKEVFANGSKEREQESQAEAVNVTNGTKRSVDDRSPGNKGEEGKVMKIRNTCGKALEANRKNSRGFGGGRGGNGRGSGPRMQGTLDRHFWSNKT